MSAMSFIQIIFAKTDNERRASAAWNSEKVSLFLVQLVMGISYVHCWR